MDATTKRLAVRTPDASLEFIHRTLRGGDIYFVSNQQNRPEKADCVFRVRGRQP